MMKLPSGNLRQIGWNELALLMGTFRDPDAEQEEPDVLMAYGEKWYA